MEPIGQGAMKPKAGYVIPSGTKVATRPLLGGQHAVKIRADSPDDKQTFAVFRENDEGDWVATGELLTLNQVRIRAGIA